MYSFFSMPKPFKGEFDHIQRNAIQSWLRLEPKPEIILFGNDFGTKEICEEHGLIHVPIVQTNTYGTPLVSDMFRQAEEIASHPVLCYINSDIIFARGFTESLFTIKQKKEKFLMIGERQDLQIDRHLDFNASNWKENLIDEALSKGVPHGFGGVDYFCFPKKTLTPLPPFAIGRTAYDLWFIWRALKRGFSVIDTSGSVFCIHQDHDRTYTSIGKAPLLKENNLRQSVEAKKNGLFLGTRRRKSYWVLNSTHFLKNSFLLPAITPRFLQGKWKVATRNSLFLGKVAKIANHSFLRNFKFMCPWLNSPSIPLPEIYMKLLCDKANIHLTQLLRKGIVQRNFFWGVKCLEFKDKDYHSVLTKAPPTLKRAALVFEASTSFKSRIILWSTIPFSFFYMKAKDAMDCIFVKSH